ncbi:choline ABC transporter permease subunit [Wenxinia marina]|uniref:Choline ABC transporter, permease protein n=1 Tax=Wenxinia marina DSM 24838 TaxID=1123501 RepID=A0A0D0Q8L1_9RHOB|nr:choline ABC transporter permease subunit [Wenxinia marina]KIQ68692.1 choline ABC transporter, permease protein [Wenxinia marina DSM 24838]GGL67968.1 choline ABC transporter permease subunit [Wenxinia marina]
MTFLRAIADALLSLLYAVGWCVQAVLDFLAWLGPAILWFVQWLPARLLGRTDQELPVGDAASRGFEYIRDGASGFLDGFSDVTRSIIDVILAILMRPPGENWLSGRRFEPWIGWWDEDTHRLVVVAAFVLLTWALQRNWKVCLLVLVGFLFILDQGYWDETAESLTLVLSACLVCMGIGVPVGIWAAHRPKVYAWLAPVLDLMQTLPTFVYLIPAIVFFGIGMVPGMIATVIFVLPAPIRLTHLGISRTPVALTEAAQAFGATRRQLLWKVELPSAYPQIMAGLNQTIMLSLSMVVIAALVGARGLGVPVVRALNSVNTSLGFESGIVIVVVAIMLDRMLRVSRK